MDGGCLQPKQGREKRNDGQNGNQGRRYHKVRRKKEELPAKTKQGGSKMEDAKGTEKTVSKRETKY